MTPIKSIYFNNFYYNVSSQNTAIITCGKNSEGEGKDSMSIR